MCWLGNLLWLVRIFRERELDLCIFPDREFFELEFPIGFHLEKSMLSDGQIVFRLDLLLTHEIYNLDFVNKRNKQGIANKHNRKNTLICSKIFIFQSYSEEVFIHWFHRRYDLYSSSKVVGENHFVARNILWNITFLTHSKASKHVLVLIIVKVPRTLIKIMKTFKDFFRHVLPTELVAKVMENSSISPGIKIRFEDILFHCFSHEK